MLFQLGKNQKQAAANQSNKGGIMKKNKFIIFVVLGVVSFFIVLTLGFILIKSPHTRIIHGYSEAYNQIGTNPNLDLFKTRLPISANKIIYRILPYMQHIEVNFKITEEKFLVWIKEQKWDIAKISIPITIGSISLKDNIIQEISIELKNGYAFKQQVKRKDVNEMLESELTVYYDSDSNTCYYSFTLL